MTKFASLRDEVVYRASLDGCDDVMGSVEYGHGWFGQVLDFYGFDYIVREDSYGFVYVERFDHIDIDDTGYFTPVLRAWDDYARVVYADDNDDESGW